jgi:hypothetical protein
MSEGKLFTFEQEVTGHISYEDTGNNPQGKVKGIKLARPQYPD